MISHFDYMPYWWRYQIYAAFSDESLWLCTSSIACACSGPLLANVTLSTEPKVHSVSHCCQRRTEPRPQAACSENSANISYMLTCKQTWTRLLAILLTLSRTHTQLFNGPLSGSTKVGRYQKKHSPTQSHAHPDHQTSFINFHHLLWSVASSMFNLRAWQSFSPTCPVWFSCWSGTLCFMLHAIFTQSSYSFLSTCLYHCSLFCCSTSVMSSVLNLSLSSLLGNLSLPKCHTAHTPPSDHSHLCFSFLAGQVSLPCNMLFHTQLLYSLPLIISDTSLLVSNATKCLDLFQPVRILACTAASASPSTLNMSCR